MVMKWSVSDERKEGSGKRNSEEQLTEMEWESERRKADH